MIIVEGWARFAPGESAKFHAAARKMAEETRKESGCLEYAFSQDLMDPDLVRVIERWEGEAALTAHFATPHMAAFNAALSNAKLVGASVKAYKAEFLRTLAGG
jgi:quinol monooxygenase YgiN